MNVLSYPLRYLSLKDESGGRLYRRNAGTVISLAAILAAPFILADMNFFSDKGFLDRVGAFFAVLTGFYIAALVGIASFAPTLGDVDDVIEVGKILRKNDDGQDEPLTRRQYVCTLFGYLSFIALFTSVVSIFSVVIVDSGFGKSSMTLQTETLLALNAYQGLGRGVIIMLFCGMISHMLVTTCHGLYYLIDRLYAKKAVILPKSSSPK